MSRHVHNWKEGRVTPSSILEMLPYTSQFTRMQSVLQYPLVRMIEKYFAKDSNASYETKKDCSNM